MPLVKYSFILSNAQGYEGLEEELKLTAEMDIPDGYNDNELKQVINEIQAELPYFQYQNVIVEVIEVQVQEKPVRSFEVKGDNIGKEQKRYIKRVYDSIAADVKTKRSNTPNPEEKIRFEKVFDGVKKTSSIFSNLLEMLFGWLDRFQAQTNRRKERRRKERMEKERLEELEEKRKDEKTFIEAELLIEREIEAELLIKREIILEKQKIRRIKAEERLEKTKLARLKKESANQKSKTEKKELELENKELKTKIKELETNISEYKVKSKQTDAIMEHLKAAINLQQDGRLENDGGFER